MGNSSTSSQQLKLSRLHDQFRAPRLDGGVPIIVAAFSSGSDFLAALSARGSECELSVETRYAPARGTFAVVEVTWSGLPNRVLLRVISMGRRAGGALTLRLHPQERAKRDFLIGVAQGWHPAMHRRKHRRFCVRLSMSWRRFGETAMLPGVAVDLSAGGVLIAAGVRPLQAGDRVAMRVRVGERLDLVVTGTVQHVRKTELNELAFGVRFEYRSSSEQRDLRALVRAFAGRGLVLVQD